MKLAQILTIILLMVLIAFLSNACSKGKSPVEPVIDNSPEMPENIPDTFGTGIDQRKVLSVYECVIDPDAKAFTITPATREIAYHLPLSQYFQNVLQIVSYGFTPNFWADIKLKHPYPESGIDGFDPRVIAILPANPGVSFNYPTLGVNGNNSVILEPDGYTKLFDNLGGSIPGNTNPFKAYFKDQPYCRWSSTGPTQETQRWQMDINGFGGPLQFKLVVDVSTNYPTPSAPVVDNAPEPVKIDAIVGPGLTSDGGSAEINVTLLDWQWQSTIGGVLVEAPDLFNDTVNLSYSALGPNPNEYVYTGTIANSLLAPEGEYKMIVATWDQVTGIYMYDEFTVYVYGSNYDGNLIWAKRVGGESSPEVGCAITTFSDNSTAVIGYFRGSTTFGPGEPNETVLNSSGHNDIFIARYNSDGTLAWAKRAGGSADDVGWGITTLSDNSIAITGYFSGSATFGPGETNQTVLTSAGSTDICIARYNLDGTLAWAKSARGASNDQAWEITSLSDNSTVVTGWFGHPNGGTATFGPGEYNQTVLTSAGKLDIFIAKYNPDGTLEWAKRAGGTSSDAARGITTLSDNSTVVSGWFEGTATFGPGEPNQTVLTSAGDKDIFIARYNSDGTLAWATNAGGSGPDYSWRITTLSDNSTVLTGHFIGSATFGLGEISQTVLWAAGGHTDSDIYIARYNSDGMLAWAKRAGGTDLDRGHGITTLSADSIVAIGYFWGTAIFGPGEMNETILNSSGSNDIYIAKYNSDGTLSWAKQAGGPSDDYGREITTLSDNSTVATGYFWDLATFGEGEPNETILTSAGGMDIFIARFEP